MSGAVGEILAAGVKNAFAGFAGTVEVELDSRSWASVTFSGERHRLRLRLEGAGAGAAADAFVLQLAEREFEIAGHLVADIGAMADEREPDGTGVSLELEALTVEVV